MHALKFRVWDLKDKRFVPDVEEIIIDSDGLRVQWDFYYEYYKQCRIPGETCIVQYSTGLKDSDGKEIFEGDILESYSQNETVKEIGVCKQVLGGWMIFNTKESISWGGWKEKIIGNIMENQ